MSPDYFFEKDHQKTGPVDREAIEKKIKDGTITSQTLIWSEGMDNWKPAGEIPELLSLFATGVQPPPLPADTGTPPPLPNDNVPSGLSPLEEKAYRFATTVFRPWRGKHSPLGAYVRENPKNAVYVSAGTIALLLAIMILFIASLSPDQNQGQAYTPGQPMPPAGWQAQHRAVMEAQQEIGQMSMDSYTYRRDRQDKSDDLYRKATYGTDD